MGNTLKLSLSQKTEKEGDTVVTEELTLTVSNEDWRKLSLKANVNSLKQISRAIKDIIDTHNIKMSELEQKEKQRGMVASILWAWAMTVIVACNNSLLSDIFNSIIASNSSGPLIGSVSCEDQVNMAMWFLAFLLEIIVSQLAVYVGKTIVDNNKSTQESENFLYQLNPKASDIAKFVKQTQIQEIQSFEV